MRGQLFYDRWTGLLTCAHTLGACPTYTRRGESGTKQFCTRVDSEGQKKCPSPCPPPGDRIVGLLYKYIIIIILLLFLSPKSTECYQDVNLILYLYYYLWLFMIIILIITDVQNTLMPEAVTYDHECAVNMHSLLLRGRFYAQYKLSFIHSIPPCPQRQRHRLWSGCSLYMYDPIISVSQLTACH